MNKSLIIGFIGNDRPGLVKSLSEVVSKHNGNWLESRMSRLSGLFAGAARVEIDEDKLEALEAELGSLENITVTLRRAPEAGESAATNAMSLNIIGPDRVGILREVTAALSRSIVNVVDMETRVAPAPMSGEPTFYADAVVEVPANANVSDLVDRLDAIGANIGVDILLEDLAEDA